VDWFEILCFKVKSEKLKVKRGEEKGINNYELKIKN